MSAIIPGLMVVKKPMETYLIVREDDGDRELTATECDLLLALAQSVPAQQQPDGLANLRAIMADQPYLNSALSIFEIDVLLKNEGGFMPDEAVAWFRGARGKLGTGLKYDKERRTIVRDPAFAVPPHDSALADRLEKYARDVSNSNLGGSQHTCDCDEAARLLRLHSQEATETRHIAKIEELRGLLSREAKDLRALWLALDGGPKPRCRDCADEPGICPSDKLPCDPQERALKQIELLRILVERQRKVLDQAELVLDQAKDCINAETPEDITFGEAEDDTISKIREAMRTIAAVTSDHSTT